MKLPRSSAAPFLASLLAVALARDASAGFTAAITPPWRGTPGASFAGFESFTQAYNAPNVPDVVGSSTSGLALTQLVPGAILTSTANIYHPAQASSFRIDQTTVGDVQEVVLQVSTFGSSADLGSFTLTYVGAGGVEQTLSPTEFIPLVQLPQQHDELYFRFDLSSVASDVTAYRLQFSASGANMSLDAVLFDERSVLDPGIAFCFGDGTGLACPCGNSGAPGRGCANSIDASGALLDAHGVASLSNDTLVLDGQGMPNSSVLYFQGTTSVGGGAGSLFGDGLRCAGGTVVRLGTTTNVAGASSYPTAGAQSVSVRGGVTTAGSVRAYQVWYRNAAAFCTASTFNLSNGYEITWLP
jgi:hypothetical protein